MSTILYHLHSLQISLADGPAGWQKRISYDLSRYLAGMEKFSPQEVTQQLIIAPYAQRPSTDGYDTVPTYTSYGAVTDFSSLGLCFASTPSILHVWHSGARELPVPFFLQLLALQNNAAFVHAAAIAINGRAILVPAFGSIGKTAFAAQINQHDAVSLMGDDLLVARADGLLAPHPRPFCLYDYHAPLFKGYFATHRFPWHTKWALTHKVIRFVARHLNLHHHLDRYVTSTHRNIPPHLLFGSDHIETNPLPLGAVVIATRRTGITQPSVTTANEQQVVSYLINVITHELQPFNDLHLVHLTGLQQTYTDHLRHLEQIILRFLHATPVPYYHVALPTTMSATSAGVSLFDIITNQLMPQIPHAYSASQRHP